MVNNLTMNDDFEEIDNLIKKFKDEEEMSHNALTFEIEGMLWAQPTPLQLYLKTEIDLDLGGIKITEHG